MTIHDGSAYVAASGPSAFGGNVTKYDAVTGGRLEGIELLACGIASGSVGVWLAGCPNVNELSSGGPGSGIRIETIPLPYPRTSQPRTSASRSSASPPVRAASGC